MRYYLNTWRRCSWQAVNDGILVLQMNDFTVTDTCDRTRDYCVRVIIEFPTLFALDAENFSTDYTHTPFQVSCRRFDVESYKLAIANSMVCCGFVLNLCHSFPFVFPPIQLTHIYMVWVKTHRPTLWSQYCRSVLQPTVTLNRYKKNKRKRKQCHQ